MSMYFCPLFSGSNGNALFVQYGGTRVLIDAGRSGRQITEALLAIGVDPASLDALLITHEHSDHISGAGIIARKYHLPVYATGGTWAAMQAKLGKLGFEHKVIITAEEDFYVGDLGIVPFSIPHDAADPVGFRLYGGAVSVATATDLGYFPKNVAEHLAGSSLVLLESNHDPDMLRQNPHYSSRLKQRILGRRGHLSNEACAEAVMQLTASGVRHLILGHLSGENNTPELAYRVTAARAALDGIRPGQDIMLDIARRDCSGPVYTIAEAD